MKISELFPGALVVLSMLGGFTTVRAADGSVVLQKSGGNLLLKVDGDKDDDWWVQSSTNLNTWTTSSNFGTILSGNETNAPWRSLGATSATPTYYRTKQTAGFYDPAVFHT